MTRAEDMSSEEALGIIAEILASGFLRLKGHAVVLGEDPREIRRANDVTDNYTN